VSSVKTTFDLPEPLLREVQALARERGTTGRSLVEQALRRLLDDAAAKSAPFTLSDASVKGKGLKPDAVDINWPGVRAAIYGLPTDE